MAYASQTDLERFLKKVRGRVTIGATASDTITVADAAAFIADAHSELEMSIGEDTFTDDTKNDYKLAIKIECLMVYKTMWTIFWTNEEGFDSSAKIKQLENEIQKLIKLLMEQIGTVAITNESYTDPDYSMFKLPKILAPDVGED